MVQQRVQLEPRQLPGPQPGEAGPSAVGAEVREDRLAVLIDERCEVRYFPKVIPAAVS